MNYKEDTAILCRNIAYLRKLTGLSITEMAAILHISVRTLTRIEHGDMPGSVSTEIFYYIRHYFGIMPHAILSRLFDESLD